MTQSVGDVLEAHGQPFLASPEAGVSVRQIDISEAEAFADFAESNHGFVDPELTESIVKIRPDEVEAINFGIWKEPGGIIGGIRLGRRRELPVVGEISFWLGLKHRGYKRAAEAVSQVADHATNNLTMERLIAYVDVGNIPAARTLKKAGFEMSDQFEDTWVFGFRKESKPTEPVRVISTWHDPHSSLQFGAVDLAGMTDPIENGKDPIRFGLDPLSGDQAIFVIGRKVFKLCERDFLVVKPNTTYMMIGFATLRTLTASPEALAAAAK